MWFFSQDKCGATFRATFLLFKMHKSIFINTFLDYVNFKTKRATFMCLKNESDTFKIYSVGKDFLKVKKNYANIHSNKEKKNYFTKKQFII